MPTASEKNIDVDIIICAQALATRHFRAKIHHRSGKPEVSPTILELIKIGIVHLESELPDTADISDKSVADELREQIKELDTRLREVEGKLSGKQSDNLPDKNAPSDNSSQDAAEDVESISDDQFPNGINKASKEPIFEPSASEPDTVPDRQGLSDGELAEIQRVNSSSVYRWRVKGTKPRPLKIARQLAEWEVRGERWFKIKNDLVNFQESGVKADFQIAEKELHLN